MELSSISQLPLLMLAFLPFPIWTLLLLLACHWPHSNATPTSSPAPISAMLGPFFLLTNCTPHPTLVNTHTWPKHSPCFPLPKQQPADTEQGRRTSLEKFTRSVVSHLELGLFISQTTLAASLSVAFAILTILHSILTLYTCHRTCICGKR